MGVICEKIDNAIHRIEMASDRLEQYKDELSLADLEKISSLAAGLSSMVFVKMLKLKGLS